MSAIRFAIYGCGNIARVHAAAINEVDGAELVAVSDVNIGHADSFSDIYGGRVIDTYDELVRDPEVDAVCISTPSGTHAELAIKAVSHGKHVVLEKPMAITVKECEDIISACEANNAKLMVISQYRTLPGVHRTRELIRSGELGRLVICNVHMKYYRDEEYYLNSWRGTKKMDGGGALMNQGIHGVDVLQYLCGEIKSIQSNVRTLIHDIEVEDTAVAVLEFENGALGVIEAATSTYPGFNRRIEICGDRGSVILKEGNIERLILRDRGIYERYTIEDHDSANNATVLDITGHKNQISDFVKALNGDTTVEICDQYEGIKAVKIIEKIYKCSK